MTAIDLFCGFGGSSDGITAAGADVVAAANHSPHAIEVHGANFPNVEHFQADLLDTESDAYQDPRKLPPARFLWASPSCTHHSPANATKLYQTGPTLFDYRDWDDDYDERYRNSERSRVTMVCPLLYAERHQPEAVVVENVLEVTHWGPNRDGSQFRDWLTRWTNLGYQHECLFLNSMFFGCPQSRDRIYIVFWRNGNPRPDLTHRPTAWCESNRCGGQETVATQAWKPRKPSWPLPSWGKYRAQYLYRCTECGHEVTPHRQPAATAIDWSDLGPTLSERPKPLAPKTLDRIRRGLTKFQHHPLVLTIDGQLAGLIDQQHLTPSPQAPANPQTALHSVLLPVAGNTYERPGQTRARATATDPAFSLTGTLEHGIATMPFHVETRPEGSPQTGQHPSTEPTHTDPSADNHHGLVFAGFTKINGGPGDTAWHGLNHPLGTITGRDTTGLITATLPLTHANSSDRARHITEPLATLTTARERYLINATPPAGDDIDLDDVHFRMLNPDPELRRAMGFPDTYQLFGTKTQITTGLGNAVTPPVASWITAQVLGSLHNPHYRHTP